jgi:hypothetical protein
MGKLGLDVTLTRAQFDALTELTRRAKHAFETDVEVEIVEPDGTSTHEEVFEVPGLFQSHCDEWSDDEWVDPDEAILGAFPGLTEAIFKWEAAGAAWASADHAQRRAESGYAQ